MSTERRRRVAALVCGLGIVVAAAGWLGGSWLDTSCNPVANEACVRVLFLG